MCETLSMLVCFLPLANRSGIETNGEETSTSLRLFWFGGLVHRVVDCKNAGVVEAMLFLESEKNTDSSFIYVGQVEMSSRKDDQMLVMFASLRVEYDVAASDVSVVCEFPDMFPRDICDLPQE